jgi:hypothetical protein
LCRRGKDMKILAGFITAILAGTLAAAPPTPSAPGDSLDSLKAEVAAMKPARIPWRQIAWKSCLLDGLKASRAQHKPMLLWVFIDRPVDDQRC